MKKMSTDKTGQPLSFMTAGELARIANISRDTLTYYIRYGLIKPDHIGDNGYKYFLPEQIMTVNFIRYYRALDFSLESIGEMLNEFHHHQDKVNQTSVMNHQALYLKEKIAELQSTLRFINWKKRFLDYLDSNPHDEVFFDDLKETSLYISPVHFCQSVNIPANAQLIADFFTDSRGNFSVPVHPICCIINRHAFDLNDLKLDDEHRVAPLVLKESSTGNLICSRPAGRYACLIHSGGNVTVHDSVMKILRHLADREISVTRNGFVMNSCDFLNVTDSQSADYIIQVELEQSTVC